MVLSGLLGMTTYLHSNAKEDFGKQKNACDDDENDMYFVWRDTEIHM